jgi:hypothetical protein
VIFPHDADPTAGGESVKGGGHRARCMPIHEDDPVAPIGSSKQRLESGRGLRPPVTCDHDDSCDRCGRHETKLTFTLSALCRSNRCAFSPRIRLPTYRTYVGVLGLVHHLRDAGIRDPTDEVPERQPLGVHRLIEKPAEEQASASRGAPLSTQAQVIRRAGK